MTKREPFADVCIGQPEHLYEGCWGIVVGGKQISTTSDVENAYADVEEINDAYEARVKEAVREAVAERDDRIADLERVLKDTCELMDKCAGRLNVFVAQHVGSRDEYFVFELNRLSVCAGALDAMSRKATSIKSVLGKGE